MLLLDDDERNNNSKISWKQVYSERLVIERNWRKGCYNVKVLEGHNDGVTCLQLDDKKKILITGVCLHTLEGHEGPVTCISLSGTKIVTGSEGINSVCLTSQLYLQ